MLKKGFAVRSRIGLLFALILSATAITTSFSFPLTDVSSTVGESAQEAQRREIAGDDEIALDRIVEADEYIVGPGDEITIVLSDRLVSSYSLKVTPEGMILIPETGPLRIAGETLAAARNAMLTALQNRYKNVQISLFLTKLRRIKVTVSGEVEHSGTYVLSAGDRVSEAVNAAGGLRSGASVRNLLTIRDSISLRADLLKYQRTGARSANPYLLEGDVIVVPTAEPMVNRLSIYGAVRSGGSYEYAPGDRLIDLIGIAYGLNTDADSASCELVRFNRDRVTSYSIQIDIPAGNMWEDSLSRVALLPDDRVFFRALPKYHRVAHVTVAGEVIFPGVYPIVEDSTRVSDAIEKAGGLTDKASLPEAWMDRIGYESPDDADVERRIRLSERRQNDIEAEYLKFLAMGHSGRVSIDFKRLIEDKEGSHDITLKDGDVITIPRLSQTVRVIGRVARPGLVEYTQGASLNYYILQAGGFGWKASKGRVHLIKGTSGAIVRPSDKNPIEVGDAIVVPEKTDRNWWGTIKDVGTFLASLATVYIVIDQAVK